MKLIISGNKYLYFLLRKPEKKSPHSERNHQPAHKTKLSQTDELILEIVQL